MLLPAKHDAEHGATYVVLLLSATHVVYYHALQLGHSCSANISNGHTATGHVSWTYQACHAYLVTLKLSGLIGLRAITGCSSRSAFACRGKKTVLVSIQKPGFCNAKSPVGDTIDIQ